MVGQNWPILTPVPSFIDFLKEEDHNKFNANFEKKECFEVKFQLIAEIQILLNRQKNSKKGLKHLNNIENEKKDLRNENQ